MSEETKMIPKNDAGVYDVLKAQHDAHRLRGEFIAFCAQRFSSKAGEQLRSIFGGANRGMNARQA